MERLQKAAILTELADQLRREGSWCGHTHMQKATYFLQDLLEVPTGYEFILYKHGPYSFDLSEEMTGAPGGLPDRVRSQVARLRSGLGADSDECRVAFALSCHTGEACPRDRVRRASLRVEGRGGTGETGHARSM